MPHRAHLHVNIVIAGRHVGTDNLVEPFGDLCVRGYRFLFCHIAPLIIFVLLWAETLYRFDNDH